MYHILVVEDDKNTNQVICEFLKESGYVVSSAFDGETAVDLFCAEKIDLVILDIMLPRKNGVEVLNEVRSISNTPVMMLSALGDDYTQIKSFDLQADEYVTKPFSPIVLVKRVTALLRRSHPMDRVTIGFEEIIIDFSAYTVVKSGEIITLTTKEMEILKFMVENQGNVVTRLQIIDAVWNYDSDISDRIVDTHIKNLRKKLCCDVIQTVKGIGYRFEVQK